MAKVDRSPRHSVWSLLIFDQLEPFGELVEHPQEQVGEQDYLGSLSRVVELNLTVTRRILEDAERARKQISCRPLLARVQVGVDKWAARRSAVRASLIPIALGTHC